jgi:hypothetical protein
MIVDAAVAQESEETLDFFIGDGLPQTNIVDIRDGHEHRRIVRHDTQMKEAAGGTENCFLFDPFNDAESMIRVDDLVTELECHVSPVEGWW